MKEELEWATNGLWARVYGMIETEEGFWCSRTAELRIWHAIDNQVLQAMRLTSLSIGVEGEQ